MSVADAARQCTISFLHGIVFCMTKVSYIELPPGYDAIYKKGLAPGDRFTFSRIRVKDLFLSRAKVKGITQKSQLVALAPVWAALSTGDKDAWTSASAASKLTGWKGFVYDTCARRRAALSGYATPNDTYQALVGRIEVVAPATGLKIQQAHPSTYYVLKKVTGTRSQYSPVPISEPQGLPFDIAISYKTDLTVAGDSPRARFFLEVYSSYQGQTLTTILEIDFGLSTDWTRSTATLSAVKGLLQGYSAFIEVYNAQGNLYFDNVEITHNAENWARDPNCNNIAQSFTHAFVQVARHWAPVDIVDGADFGSVYYSP